MKIVIKNSQLLLSLICVVLVGCSKAPPPEPKNEFEAAVYHSIRSDADIDQDSARKPAEILAFSSVKPGMTVVDLLAGDGYFSELFSLLVGPEGKVYLHNKPKSAKKLAEKINNRIHQRLENVTSISGDLTEMQLPDAVDAILISKVFHDLYVPDDSPERKQIIELFFSQLKNSLKSGGKVLLIDHTAPQGSATSLTKDTHRIAEDFVIKKFEEQGFNFLAKSDVLRNKNDKRTLNIWESEVRNKTDQFVILLEKNQ